MRFDMLKRPVDFKRVRGGGRHASPLFIVEGRPRPIGEAAQAGEISRPRFGFTITRKVGTAVVRNRIRRRLKEALRALDASYARPDHDYVVVASLPVREHPFEDLKAALGRALETVHRGPARRNGAKDGRSRPGEAARSPAPLPRQRKSGKATASADQPRPSARQTDPGADASQSATPTISRSEPTDS